VKEKSRLEMEKNRPEMEKNILEMEKNRPELEKNILEMEADNTLLEQEQSREECNLLELGRSTELPGEVSTTD
jgi:hypothetical protein